jgi:hypothetical protein
VYFEVVGEVANTETIAAGRGIRQRHWYEAHGVGKRDMKFKRYRD